nr:serine protease [Amycolatopsis benzoatilytica]
MTVSRTALVVCAAAVLVATGSANAVVTTADVTGTAEAAPSKAGNASASPSPTTTAPSTSGTATTAPSATAPSAAGTPSPTSSSPASAPSAPVANADSAPVASAAVGALFSGGKHFCSASVVHSPGGDLILTAAHCVNGDVTAISFEPGYHDGIAPYGSWQVTAATIADGWTSSADPDLDFAFLKVAQPGPASLESLTGANLLGTDQGFSHTITLTGYPDGSERPVVCTGTTTQSDTYQQRVACPGFPDGTSGGPWVINADPNTGLGTVVGAIGGYQTGGDTADVSYSAYFDGDVAQLYNTAIS